MLYNEYFITNRRSHLRESLLDINDSLTGRFIPALDVDIFLARRLLN